MEEKKKGIGLIGLIGMVISSCIGSGVFAITGQLAGVASPGAVLIAWLIVGVGFLALAFSLNNLTEKRSDLHGIFSYADAGWGPLAGFISGWGYWLSAWLGNVAFATMMMSTIGYFYPAFLPGNTIPCIIIASIVMWALTYLVIRGVESAAFLNAIVMVCKVAAIAVTLIFGIFLFNAGIFTADFWGNVYDNAVAAGQYGPDAAPLGGVGTQIFNCMIIMMWVFIGIEGAVAISGRAKKAKDVGKATIIAFICVLTLYLTVSILSMGVMPLSELANLENPALAYVMQAAVGDWGAVLINFAVSLSLIGAMLGYTVLASESPFEAAEEGVFIKAFAKTNAKGAPVVTLVVTNIIIELFLITWLFTDSTYQFFYTLSAGMILLPYLLSAAYFAKVAFKEPEAFKGHLSGPILWWRILGCVGVVYSLFLSWAAGVLGVILMCLLYVPGIIMYIWGKKERGEKYFQSTLDKVVLVVIIAAACLSIYLLVTTPGLV